MEISLWHLYAILRQAAIYREIISYTDLSVRYRDRMEVWHEPHGTWDQPLHHLNRLTHAARGLPISAIVTYRVDRDDPNSRLGPPGEGFWTTFGAPPRPATAAQREVVWMGVVNEVHRPGWPELLPGLDGGDVAA
jgi:hypothetical protein